MAEKPRLKKSDEILGSIAAEAARAPKRTGGASARPSSGNRERRPEPEPKYQEPVPDEEELETDDQPVLPSAQTLAEKLMLRDDKRKTLNFGKYELPKRDAAPTASSSFDFSALEPVPVREEVSFSVPVPQKPSVTPEPVVFAEPEPAAKPKSKPAPPPKPRPAPAPASPPVPAPESTPTRVQRVQKQAEGAPPITLEHTAPLVTEYTFQSFEQQEDDRPVREFSMDSDEENPPEPRRHSRERQKKRGPRDDRPGFRPEEPQFEPEYEPSPPPPTPPPVPPTPVPPPVPAPAPIPAEPQISEEERSRQDFLKRIANQFELQFEEKFEQGALPARETARRAPEPVKPERQPERRPEPEYTPPAPAREPPAPEPEAPVVEDFFSYVKRQERERAAREPEPVSPRETVPDSETPASDFIEKFRNDIQNEERERSEDFKNTLAEKFARERERYLKELELSPDVPDVPNEPEPPAARRKLDFQIQPEMHLREGEEAPPPKQKPKPAAGPVTYTRGGAARPLDELDEPDAPPRPATGMSASRKTAEQLLMEHGALSKTGAAPTAPKPAKLQFTFSTPEELAKSKKKDKEPILPTEKWPRRIVLIAMAAGLFAIGLMLWPLIKYVQLSERLAAVPDPAVSEAEPVSEDILNVYNDMSYTQTAKANNVVFKNANVTLKNVDVADYAVIEGIDSSGKVRLEDVSVGTAVSVKSSGIDSLELHNVKTARLIINNPMADISITATGNTDVGVVELRTPATVGQSEIVADSPGFRSMVITPAEAGSSINAKLIGLSLQTLNTSAVESIIAFENDSRAETVSADGSLSLTGLGSVVNLAVGARTGLGAGDLQDATTVTVFVKGVTITNLNVKSPANLNLATTVDNVSTSDTLLIGGDGNVGSLTLNSKAGSSGRLLVDVAGLNIQSVFSNAASRVSITGSAHVNTLSADESTYVLGNKVNHLKVNADGVIYETEPDKITVAANVRPPQSKAENPNLDYSLGTPAPAADATGGDFATTCGHSRESGGFLLGNGSRDAPFEVSSPAQLSHVSSHLASYFIQTADIDIASDSKYSGGFPMIGSSSEPFTGSYDGNGFSISNLRIISSDENVGLFASNKGTIQNVRLVSGEINSNASSLSYIGGIAGLNSDSGSIRSCSNGAAVNGNQNTYTGGIVGYNFGAKVHDCYNLAKISGLDTVGGLVGFNRQGATLTGSYSAGLVNGRDQVGGVAGANENATIANCYYLIDAADFGIGEGGGTAVEKTSDELQDPQMAADLAAGNESSLWIPGDASATGYSYPMHRKPAAAP